MSNAKNSCERQGTVKELDEETGLYYYGARYLDPKYSMWISTDPALGEYIPMAPVNDEIRKNNQNLPGMGGIFNHINSNLYHYAGNNPIKYTAPTGAYSVDDENKTITADIDDYRDLLAARNAFFELEKQGFKCQALNKDGDGVEFSTARDMFDFVDFINPDKPKLMSVEDIISLMGNISAITSDATKLKYPTLAKCTNVASVILNAGSLVLFDLSQAINNPNWDTISDAVITAVGFIPGYGTYISLGLSASKVAGKGIYRFSTDFINFSIHLQENLANYYCEQTFGYRPF